ncbi:MAG: ATP-binding protein [Bacteroidota bacterium]
MPTTLTDLTKLIATGEGLHLEFKRKVPSPARFSKEVVALANTQGGRLLIGVDDDGTPVGVRDAEETEYTLHEALSTCCVPLPRFATEQVPVTRRRTIIVVKVPPSTRRPHFVQDADGSRTAYVRVEDMSVEASKEAVRLMRFEQNERDVQFEFGEKELLLMRYLEAYSRITVLEFSRLANIPRKRASQTLVLLAKAKILQLHADPKQDYFTRSFAA